MVAFGERIAVRRGREPRAHRHRSSHRSPQPLHRYIAYARLKEVLDRPEQLRAGDTLAAQISAGFRRD